MTFKSPSSTIIALTTTLLAVIFSAAAVIFSSYVNQEVLPEQDLTIPNESASSEDKLAYCQKWASIQGIITPQCVGQWELNDYSTGNCNWQCQAEPATQSNGQ